MADDLPGEPQVGHLGVGGGRVGDHAPLVLRVGEGVALLHQQAAADAAVGPPLAVARQIAHLHQPDAGLPLGPGGEDFDGGGVEVGRHDGLDEQSRLGEHFGGGGVDGAVGAQHAPERAEGIAGQALAHGFGQRAGHGRAAGVVVLDDRDGGVAEGAGDLQGAVQVEVVVVGEFLAVKLDGGDQVRPTRFGLGVQGRLLVRVLAVAEHGLAPEGRVERSGKFAFGRLAGEEGGNRLVVAGRMREGPPGQLLAQLGRGGAAGLDLVEDLRVLARVGGDRGEGVVLGRRAH